MKIFITAVCITWFAILSLYSGEIAFPDIAVFGKGLNDIRGPLLGGSPTATQPIELAYGLEKGVVIGFKVAYPDGTPAGDITNTIAKQMNVPVKVFIKESGTKIFGWRDEKRYVAIMFFEKSEETGKSLIVANYFKILNPATNGNR
jgi:hypothetical protein